MVAKRFASALAALTLAQCKMFDITGGTGGPPRGPWIYAVYLSPAGYALVVGETVHLTAVATTQRCDIEFCNEPEVPASFTWLSSDNSIVTVSGGLVRAVGRGTAYVTAKTGGVTGSAAIRVGDAYVPFARVGAGGQCALTAAGAAYCWGGLSFTSPDTVLVPYMPRRLAGGLTFTSIAPGGAMACGITADGQGYCWGHGGDAQRIAGGLTFLSLSAGRRDAFNPGYEHTCGVAADGSAWCWGADDAGQLGTDSTLPTCFGYPCSDTPVRVVGGRTFTAISAGGKHTCALAPDGTAYCWGDNSWGQLGDSATVSRAEPMPVRGAPRFVALAAGTDHTCGLTGGGTAFCWGRNDAAQLGLGSQDSVPHSVPASVAGDVTFTSLDAAQRTCALTPAGDVYCWGGSLTVPTLVGGGLVFRSVGVGPGREPGILGFGPNGVACGVAADARAYCWTGSGPPSRLVGPVQP
jgi:hypothetical protein